MNREHLPQLFPAWVTPSWSSSAIVTFSMTLPTSLSLSFSGSTCPFFLSWPHLSVVSKAGALYTVAPYWAV